MALGPHPQRELSLMPRLGFACPRLGIAAGAPSCPACPSIPSTLMLSDTPDKVRAASERKTPVTIANASSSSGRTRRSSAACARSARASSSKATRSVGRQALCHASAARSAPPAAKAAPTVIATARAREIRHAHSAAAAAKIRKVDANGWMISGARNPTTEPARRPTAGIAATVRMHGDVQGHHRSLNTMDTKDTKV
jgi:hypothetical protein